MKSLSIFAIACFAVAAPQADEPAPTIRAETRVVQIDLVAIDSHGNPVTDLRKEDVSILDNGKPRPIDIFTVNSGLNGTENFTAPSATPPSTPLPPHVFSNRESKPPDDSGHRTASGFTLSMRPVRPCRNSAR